MSNSSKVVVVLRVSIGWTKLWVLKFLLGTRVPSPKSVIHTLLIPLRTTHLGTSRQTLNLKLRGLCPKSSVSIPFISLYPSSYSWAQRITNTIGPRNTILPKKPKLSYLTPPLVVYRWFPLSLSPSVLVTTRSRHIEGRDRTEDS